MQLLENARAASMIFLQGEGLMIKDSTTRPSMNQILAYAKVKFDFLFKHGYGDLPPEFQLDVRQNAAVWFLENEHRLDPSLGWQGWVSERCEGLVHDFKKDKAQYFTTFHGKKGLKRKNNTDKEGRIVSVDQTLNSAKSNSTYLSYELPAVTNLEKQQNEVKWDLLMQMASDDKELKAFLMQIFAVQLDSISQAGGVSISRSDQVINKFISRFVEVAGQELEENPDLKDQISMMDMEESLPDPRLADLWNRQIAWCLRIADRIGWPDHPHYVPGNKTMIGVLLPKIDIQAEAAKIHQNHVHKAAQNIIDDPEIHREQRKPDWKKAKAIR